MWVRFGAVAIALLAASAAKADDRDLYYASDKSFENGGPVELRLAAGLDFSNPFLNVRSLQLGAYYHLSPHWALGAEGAVYDSSLRSSAEKIQKELAAAGSTLQALAPRKGVNGVVRFTPISGLVNFLSLKIIKAEISLVARVGVTEYQSVGGSLLVGGGLDINLGLSRSWGIHTSFNWNVEKVSDWQWRNGFLLGPSLRF